MVVLATRGFALAPPPCNTSSGLGLTHSERLPLGDDDHAVVDETVEQAGGGGVLGQESSPVLEGEVRGDTEGPSLVGGSHETEQQLAAGQV